MGRISSFLLILAWATQQLCSADAQACDRHRGYFWTKRLSKSLLLNCTTLTCGRLNSINPLYIRPGLRLVLNVENASSQVAQVHKVVDDGIKVRHHSVCGSVGVQCYASLDWITEERSHVLRGRRHS